MPVDEKAVASSSSFMAAGPRYHSELRASTTVETTPMTVEAMLAPRASAGRPHRNIRMWHWTIAKTNTVAKRIAASAHVSWADVGSPSAAVAILRLEVTIHTMTTTVAASSSGNVHPSDIEV